MAPVSSSASRFTPFSLSKNPHPLSSKDPPSVLRSLAITLLILLLLIAVSVSIAWFLLHPRLPAVKAESLSISGFNISNAGFTGKYDFQITITNLNKKINLWIDHFSLQMVYKNIAVSKVESEPHEGILILRNMQSQVKFQMNMSELNDKKRRKIFKDMLGDWGRGVISFDVMMNIWVKFRSGFLPSRQTLLKVSCQNLNILFSSPKDFGYWQGGKHCQVGY